MENEYVSVEVRAKVEKLLSSDPDMRKKLRKIMGNVLRKARTDLSKDAKRALPNDPRQAYKAVKHTVYRRIVGGNLSILSKRKASNIRVHVEKERKLKNGQRGGNRIKRTARTESLDSYWGADRGFILRFINSGAGLKDKRKSRYGNRGSIKARNWFQNASHAQMVKASELFCKMIDDELSKLDV